MINITKIIHQHKIKQILINHLMLTKQIKINPLILIKHKIKIRTKQITALKKTKMATTHLFLLGTIRLLLQIL